MSNERERLAREWATSTLPRGDAKTLAAIEHIMATTEEPTMADVGWSDEKHHLAGATLLTGSDRTDVVMLAESGNGIYFATSDWGLGWEPHYYLAPNGKRYELVEVTDKPEHPETLSTLEDYENAPIWTIVTGPVLGPAYLKVLDGKWVATACTVKLDSIDLVEGNPGDSTMFVLRWGWGE